MQGLNWITKTVPLAAGLNQKADVRALEPPGLLIAKDVEFDDTGALRTRLPYPDVVAAISNVRRVYEYDDELLIFTKDALFSYAPTQQDPVSRGTHLAVKVEETPTFVTTGDQIDCDRAELQGLVVFAWADGSNIVVGVKDKTTGAVLLSPSSVAGSRPSLVALTTKILLFWRDGSGNLVAQAIDPAGDPVDIPSDLAAPTTVLAAASFNSYYDVVKQPGADAAIFACRRQVTTSYTIGKVTSALVVTTSTKARTCDGPIAVSCEPTGISVQVARANSTNIQGDFITIVGFVDVATGQALGSITTIPATPTNQIAAAHRSTTDGGQYRCYVFWSAAEDDGGTTTFTVGSNFVDTGGTIGTQSNFAQQMGVVSRAFDYDGRVFVVLGHEGEQVSGSVEGRRAELQNSYFLYRDDGFLCAKSATFRGGGFCPSIGRLPHVQRTDGTTGFRWCGTERRIIPVGTAHNAYADRGPREIRFTFDSNEARRVARLGETLYVSGGEILQYDGVQLGEVGFHVYPWKLVLALAATGSVADGAYTYKQTWRHDNAKGERDRSTTATYQTITMTGGPRKVTVNNNQPPRQTHRSGVVVETWRTKVNPNPDDPMYLVTSQDPAATSNPNRYLPAPGPTSSSAVPQLNDELADADVALREQSDENGGVLENLAPPPASIIVASDTRLFLAGVPGEPDRVFYSKLRVAGRVASFHDGNAIDIPRAGGAITALAFLNETLIVFRESAIYACAGDGFDNLGQGQNFVARELSPDIGAVSHEAVGKTPLGLVFKSSKGWQLLNRGWAVNYIGAGVADYDSETVLAVQVVETQHQVRCLTSSRMLVLDYIARGPDGSEGQWGEWTISGGVHATMWQGVHVYATDSSVKAQQSLYTGLTYGWDVETAWIKLNELTGYGQVAELQFLLEWRSACAIRVRVARDYQQTYFDDKIMQQEPGRTVGDPWQFRHAPSIQPMEAIKIRLTAIGPATTATLNTGVDYDADPIEMKTAVGVFAGVWTSLLQAQLAGEDGNDITMTVGCKLGTTRRIRTRDHQTWNPVTETWSNLLNNVGVQIVAAAVGDPQAASAAQIEASITANSELIEVNTPDSTPTDQVDMATMTGLTMTADFGITTAGADADNTTAPTGEAAKLTGITLKLGIRPGLHRNIPPARLQ